MNDKISPLPDALAKFIRRCLNTESLGCDETMLTSALDVAIARREEPKFSWDDWRIYDPNLPHRVRSLANDLLGLVWAYERGNIYEMYQTGEQTLPALKAARDNLRSGYSLRDITILQLRKEHYYTGDLASSGSVLIDEADLPKLIIDAIDKAMPKTLKEPQGQMIGFVTDLVPALIETLKKG